MFQMKCWWFTHIYLQFNILETHILFEEIDILFYLRFHRYPIMPREEADRALTHWILLLKCESHIWNRVGPMLMRNTIRKVKEAPDGHLTPVLDLLIGEYLTWIQAVQHHFQLGNFPLWEAKFAKAEVRNWFFWPPVVLGPGAPPSLGTLDAPRWNDKHCKWEETDEKKQVFMWNPFWQRIGNGRKSPCSQRWQQVRPSVRSCVLNCSACAQRRHHLGSQGSPPQVQSENCSWAYSL